MTTCWWRTCRAGGRRRTRRRPAPSASWTSPRRFCRPRTSGRAPVASFCESSVMSVTSTRVVSVFVLLFSSSCHFSFVVAAFWGVGVVLLFFVVWDSGRGNSRWKGGGGIVTWYSMPACKSDVTLLIDCT